MMTALKHLIRFTVPFLFQMLVTNSFGQITVDTTTIIDQIEIVPVFPGGEMQLYCFMDKNLDKEKLKSTDTSGIAVVKFTVDFTGIIKDIKIVKSFNTAIDKELLRVVALMPKWTPGRQLDKPISTTMNLPLRIPYENKYCR